MYIKTILIFIACLIISGCGELNQNVSTSSNLGKSITEDNQDIMCAMVMVPMFNPNTTLCAEAKDACEANSLKQEGFISLSIKDYCDMGCESSSCDVL